MMAARNTSTTWSARANVAAVYVTHKVLPLDHGNFGRLPAQTVQSAEAFHAAAFAFAARVRERVHVIVPFPPDSNLVCVAFNPAGNRDIAGANAFLLKAELGKGAVEHED